MPLTALTDKSQMAGAIKILKESLTRDCRRYARVIGFQAGSFEGDVYWNDVERYWSCLGPGRDERFFCGYGVQDPESTMTNLSITCEINPPHQGIKRSCRGVLVCDLQERIYLGHSGHVNRGQRDVGGLGFSDVAEGLNWQPVRWRDGVTQDRIIIGYRQAID